MYLHLSALAETYLSSFNCDSPSLVDSFFFKTVLERTFGHLDALCKPANETLLEVSKLLAQRHWNTYAGSAVFIIYLPSVSIGVLGF